jgi:dienelactone hydrolase
MRFALLLLAAACVTRPPTDPGDDTDGSVDTDPTVDTDPIASDDTDPTDLPCGNGRADPGEACDPALDPTGACGCQPDCTWAAPASPCDDGDACTTGDACDGAGACLAARLDCDDGDACTADRCDAGACLHDGWSGDPLDLFDLALLRDPSTLNLRVVNTQTVLEGLTPVRVQEVRFTSYESDACALSPIELEAYVATPTSLIGGGPVPGLTVAHGLGAFAEAGSASNPAAQLGVVAIAYSGPGQGQSQGTGSVPDHLFDVLASPTDSWFWEHAAAAMRALTVLETLPEVDPARLAMSGYSGGAVATHMVNGVDDRLIAAVPISGTGHLDLAATNPITPGWELDLLESMTPPRDAASPEWQRYVASLDPKNFLPTAHAPVFLVNGAQDEFFPIDSTVATMRDLPATSRLYSVINWDHGWFALFAGDEPAVESDQNFEYWMRHHLGLGAAYANPIPQPTLLDVVPGLCDGLPCAMAVVDLPATPLRVREATVHVSLDGLAYVSFDLDDGGLGWTGGLPTLDPAAYDRAHAVWIAEFKLQSGAFGPLVTVSSLPSLPPGFHPTILGIAGPLPL